MNIVRYTEKEIPDAPVISDDADIDSRGVAKSLVLAEEVERAATEAETSEAQFAGERAEATKMRVGEP